MKHIVPLFTALLLSSCALFAATKSEPPYRLMDYGPSLNWTYQIEKDHIVYKGTAGLDKAHARFLQETAHKAVLASSTRRLETPVRSVW